MEGIGISHGGQLESQGVKIPITVNVITYQFITDGLSAESLAEIAALLPQGGEFPCLTALDNHAHFMLYRFIGPAIVTDEKHEIYGHKIVPYANDNYVHPGPELIIQMAHPSAVQIGWDTFKPKIGPKAYPYTDAPNWHNQIAGYHIIYSPHFYGDKTKFIIAGQENVEKQLADWGIDKNNLGIDGLL
ncbi:MAG: hypothetical protein CEN88_300 [Candidatus Berkelbacteria bacterium Licking1014_2]|uniref:Uncharacterized protein n=1 Tax=Candidatus Berkelbacteria bacterium Licking1014_2 TaxID=2017146 RepID=A0A554LVF0_9BACT|nr:MAG: hypothetical protein CEN88_300 [Candidatus Berkelbacteria bacterium Licking1014_2]